MKKIITCFLLCFLSIGSLIAQVPSYVPTSGLVGWWPFTGNAIDSSGNGNHGTNNGATLTTDRNGISNSAFYFSGASCSTRIDASINTSSISAGFTLSFWSLKSGAGCVSPRLIEFWPGNDIAGYFGIAQDPGANPVITKQITSSSTIGYLSFNYEANNVWAHYVYTNDGSNIRMYQNGLLISTTPSIGSISLASNASFGRMNHPANDAHEGKLDDIGIWNRALTQQEITALYNAQTCNSTSNTITADGSTTFCAGNFVNLTSDVVGGTYQWKKNGINIATNSTSRTFKATSTGSYTCVATCNGTALTSNAIAVTSKTNASASITASGATSFCAGDSVTLNCTNLGSNYSVQWYRTNVSIENATAYTQVVKQPGTYKVVTKNLTNGCSRISGSAITTNVNCRIANYSNMSTTGNLNDEARFDATELSNGIKIYPNPNNGSFQFKYEGEESGDAQLQVINTMGQTVYRANVNIEDGFLLKEIMLGDNFQKGIYIVRLLINGGQNDSRVLIQ